jgi:hypothetical protein
VRVVGRVLLSASCCAFSASSRRRCSSSRWRCSSSRRSCSADARVSAFSRRRCSVDARVCASCNCCFSLRISSSISGSHGSYLILDEQSAIIHYVRLATGDAMKVAVACLW